MEYTQIILPLKNQVGVIVRSEAVKGLAYEAAEAFELYVRHREPKDDNNTPDTGFTVRRTEENEPLELTFEQAQCVIGGLTYLALARRQRAEELEKSKAFKVAQTIDSTHEFRSQRRRSKVNAFKDIADRHKKRASHYEETRNAIGIAIDQSMALTSGIS